MWRTGVSSWAAEAAVAAALAVALAAAGCGDAAPPRTESPAPQADASPTPRDTSVPAGLAPAAEYPERPAAPVVALVPSDDAAVTAALRAGIELAFDEARAAGGPDLALQVPAGASKWSSATEGAVDTAVEGDAVAIVTPPERRHAHLLSQLGTKLRVPILSTSAAVGVVAAGSRWVASVVPVRDGVRDEAPVPPEFDATAPAAEAFVAAFRAKSGRDPGPWDAVGYDAGRCAVEAVRARGVRRDGWIQALEAAAPVRGAAWSLTFARNGAAQRVPRAQR